AGADGTRRADTRRRTGHMASMTVEVERIGVGLRRGAGDARVVGRSGEIEAADDLRGRKRAGLDHRRIVRRVLGRVAAAAERRMRVIDTRVDDADLHAFAAADRFPYCRRAAPGHALGIVELVDFDAADRANAGQVAHARDLGSRQLDAQTVRGYALRRQDFRAMLREQRLETLLLRRDAIGLFALLQGRRERAGRLQARRIQLRDSRLVELHEQLHAFFAVADARAVHLQRATRIRIA